jgi:hypothetical protein
VDRRHTDADPDLDPNFHVDADPDPDWHQNNADPHADPATSFTHVEQSIFFTFSGSTATFQWFNFLISVMCHDFLVF